MVRNEVIVIMYGHEDDLHFIFHELIIYLLFTQLPTSVKSAGMSSEATTTTVETLLNRYGTPIAKGLDGTFPITTIAL